MAVPEQTPYSEHTGNGSTTSFALGFQCEIKDHLIVLVDDIEPPIATWSLTGGNVVFTTAPAAGKKITAQRNTPFSRTTDYQSYNNSFRPPAVNKDFDWIWLKLQELGVADWILSTRINDLRAYVEQQDSVLQENIDNLRTYVDDRDDELRAYLLDEIRKQGVALDQLEDYYSYLMQRLAQIAVDKGWDASFVVDGNITQHERNTGVKSLNQLRLTKPSKKGDRVFLASVNEDQNKGGGDFIATQKAGLVDNGGTIIASPNPLLFWVRTNYDVVTPEMFSAVSGQDCTEALQKAFDTRFKVELDEAIYLINKPVRVYDDSIVVGKGQKKSIIAKTTSTAATGWSDVTTSTGTHNFSNIDAVLVVYPTTDYGYARHVHLEGFALDRKGQPAPVNRDLTKIMPVTAYDGSGHIPQGYTLYAPIVCESVFKDLFVSGGEYNIYCKDAWLNTWERVHANGGAPWSILSGTSNSLIGCWATNTSWVTKTSGGADSKGYSSYEIGGYYNNFSNCASDGAGRNGAPARDIWRFRNGSGNSCTSLGIETAHVRKLFSVVGSAGIPAQVIINNLMTHKIYNKYADGVDLNYNGLFQVSTYASLTIESGDLRTEYTTNIDPNSEIDNPQPSATVTKPAFASVAAFSTLKIGLLNSSQKVTGVNDNSNNQIWLDKANSGVLVESGITSLTYGVGIDFDGLYSGLYRGKDYTERAIITSNPSALEAVNAYAHIMLGSSTDVGTPYIDLKTGKGNSFDARIIAEGGQSGVTGSAVLKVAANSVELSGVGSFVVSASTTSTDLANKSNVVNTDHKTLGFEAYCTDTQRFYKSTGSSATSAWRAMDDNSVVITPA